MIGFLSVYMFTRGWVKVPIVAATVFPSRFLVARHRHLTKPELVCEMSSAVARLSRKRKEARKEDEKYICRVYTRDGKKKRTSLATSQRFESSESDLETGGEQGAAGLSERRYRRPCGPPPSACRCYVTA
ncbi:hypothetical protein KM043_010770 [Ampulex compressa]|nr:hypothetical protein KM043_010770 [Ampulex compressa]